LLVQRAHLKWAFSLINKNVVRGIGVPNYSISDRRYSVKNIYLYVKTHSKTGLKYLGKTTKDPFTYLGSGIEWRAHFKEFGCEHTTEVLKECLTNEELGQLGRYYSNLWNVAESKDWANKIPETGGGGPHTEERKALFRQQQLGKKKPPRSAEHTENQAKTIRGRHNPKTSEGLRKWYQENSISPLTIEKRSNSIKEWYLKNHEVACKKSQKAWDSIYEKNYDKYRMAIGFISNGKTTKEITTLMKIDRATVRKLKNKSHRVFHLFPEFVELMGT